MIVRFPPFRLDSTERRLWRDGEPVEAQDQVIEVLAALVERPGGLWTRDDLHARLWPDAMVSEDALFQAVAKARRSLGDSARSPRWIATVSGQGYRFLGAVSRDAEGSPPGPLVALTPVIPVPGTSFAGRDVLLARLSAAFAAGGGLWTLTGPGGMGKTRLSLELIRRVSPALGGGALICDLQPAAAAGDLTVAIGRCLHVAGQRLGELDAAAEELAARRDVLLVLDNGEHVAELLAEQVAVLLRAAPEARLMVTSRVRLGLPEEQLVDLPPLGLPPPDASLEELRAHPATQILLDRAAAGGFVAHPSQAADLAGLARALAGLPLALELAAPRLRMLSPGQLLARMDRHLDLLGGPGGGHPARHGSLRVVIATSWDLLDAAPRAALPQLSTFAGPFSAEAAEAALRFDDRTDPLVVLAELLDHSLIRRREGDGPDALLELLPSVRDFAAEQLPDRAPVLDRVVEWYASDRRVEPHPDRAAERARAEQACLEQALEHALRRGQVEAAARILAVLAPAMLADGPLGALARRCAEVRAAGTLPLALERALLRVEAEARLLRFETSAFEELLVRAEALGRSAAMDALRVAALRHGGHVEEAVAVGLRSLAEPGAPEIERAELLVATAGAEWSAARSGAGEAHVREALVIIEARGLRRLRGAALGVLGSMFLDRGRFPECLALFEEMLDLVRDTSQRLDQAGAHERIGTTLVRIGRLDDAERHFLEGERLALQSGSSLHIARIRENRGKLAVERGALAEGEARFRAARQAFEDAGHHALAAVAGSNLGQVLARQGKLDEAEKELLAALEVTRGGRTVGITLHNLGTIAALRGDSDRARARFAEAIEAHRRAGLRRSEALAGAALGQLELEAGNAATAAGIFGAAVVTLSELGIDAARGGLLALLGTALSGLEGRAAAAREAFAEGERLLRDAGMLGELGLALCRRGFAHVLWGEEEAARGCLDEARRLARAQGSTPGDELGQAVTLLAARLGADERPGPRR